MQSQYVFMLKDAKERTDMRKSQCVGKNYPVTLRFYGDSNSFEFLKTPRPDVYEATKKLNLRLYGNSIRVYRLGVENHADITLISNDEGACPFRVDGEGFYLRRQVLSHFLELLFYPKQ